MRAGSFTAAAERLYTSQPGISKQLKQLEAELDVYLDQLVAGVNQSKTDLTGASAGLGQVSGGLSGAIDGANQLHAGAGRLVTGLGQAEAGVASLIGGVGRLQGGLSNPNCDRANPTDPLNPCGLREGLDSLSMRRLADELGSGALSLYQYVPNKEQLLEVIGAALAVEQRVEARR